MIIPQRGKYSHKLSEKAKERLISSRECQERHAPTYADIVRDRYVEKSHLQYGAQVQFSQSIPPDSDGLSATYQRPR